MEKVLLKKIWIDYDFDYDKNSNEYYTTDCHIEFKVPLGIAEGIKSKIKLNTIISENNQHILPSEIWRFIKFVDEDGNRVKYYPVNPIFTVTLGVESIEYIDISMVLKRSNFN